MYFILKYFCSPITTRLDYFLIFFQHYYWFKKSDPIFSSKEDTADLFPILTDHYYKECLLTVRPKLKLFKTFEQAKEEIEKLQMELYPNLFSTTENAANGDLDTITEEGNDQTDTNNDNTEDTSEAFGSDDEIRQRHADEDENAVGNDGHTTDVAVDEIEDVKKLKNVKTVIETNFFFNFLFNFFYSYHQQTNWIQLQSHVKSNVQKKIMNSKKHLTKCMLTAIKNVYAKT